MFGVRFLLYLVSCCLGICSILVTPVVKGSLRRAAVVENINLAAADEMWSKGTFCVPIGGGSDSEFSLAATLWHRLETPG